MPKRKQPYARIAITLPPAVLAAADRLARRLERSRSWVIAEAIRRLASGFETEERAARGPAVREPAAPAYATNKVAAARVEQLKADLALPPTERLRRAEELLQLARSVRPRTTRKQIIAFENWEDFATWKAARRINL